MPTMFQDFVYASRMLRKNPGLTTAAILTLAFGIAANTVIFSGINAILLRPLPCENLDQLMMIWQNNAKINLQEGKVSYPDFFDWKKQSLFTQDMGIFSPWGFALTGVAEPVHLKAALVSADFFSVLKTKPKLGRTFLPEEDQPGAVGNVVISHGLWQQHFGANPNVIGQALRLNDHSSVVQRPALQRA